MSASALLVELENAGIRLDHDGDALFANVLPGWDITQYRDRIAASKPLLLAVLHLQDQIVAAASAAQEAFDRATYDELWRRWHALQEGQETTP